MNKLSLIAAVLILVLFLIGVYFYPSMPEKMASHWNARGEVDGYMSKFWGVFLLPLITGGIYLLFLAIPKIDPLRRNIELFKNYYHGFILTFVGFMFYIYIFTIYANLGYEFNMNFIIVPAMGVLFFLVGVVMSKAKRNWFIGFRTPWTLSSDKVWNKTHEIGSKLFKIYAIFLVATLFFEQYLAEYFLWIVLAPVLTIAIGLMVYSYFLYTKLEK